jgi:MerR family transcriptional regulator, thiopeptide resistance regulator
VSNKTYRTGQFAKKASVTERTLRFYDKVGLLSPRHYSDAGYRLYTDEDYPRLQQILGLKYLGFSLEEIQECLKNGPTLFKDALAVQKAMMQDRKAHLEAIIRTIEETEARLEHGARDWEPIIQIIEVIQMEEKKEWINKYFSDEQVQKMNEISADAYTEEDRARLAEWGAGWSEEDQREADRKWAELYAEAKRLADAGQDPAGEDAQALAGRWMGLVGEFTRSDPGVTTGLKKFWEKIGELPPEQAPLPNPFSPEQQAFMDRVLSIYEQRKGPS